MSGDKQFNKTAVHVVAGDITELEVDGFVFYATPDLKLGTGIGNAISLRGGPTIQAELSKIGEQAIGAAVATAAGKLKAECIIHAVGPGFQEKNLESKLRAVTLSALEAAAEKGLRRLAMPPMGTGFYGVPDALSAKIMTEVIREFSTKESSVKDITICVLDSWDTPAFEDALSKVA